MRSLKLHRVRSLLIGCVVTVFLCLLSPSAFLDGASAAQSEEERTAALVEGAKKEGKLLWYTTIPADAAYAFKKKYQEKYPFVDIEIFRTTDSGILTKILAEVGAKRDIFDLVYTTGIPTELLKHKGVFSKYLSPQRKFYSEGYKDPEGYWTDTFLSLTTIGYNTKLVSAREAPKTWQDLLNAKWRRKMCMDTKAFWWFANMLKVMGEKNGLEYMESLSKQEILFRTGRTLNTQIVAAGEVSIGITLYNYAVEDFKAKGASIEWVALDPVVPEIHPIGISAHAPHPNAAKLLVDMILSREGQEFMANTFGIPSRTDVDAIVPKLKKGLKLLPFDFSIAGDYNRYVKLYRDVLMKK